MQFKYKAIDSSNTAKEGVFDAANVDIAIASLQKRGLIVSYIKENQTEDSFGDKIFGRFFKRVSNRDIVMLSQQIAVLFEAQVSALKVFTMLATENENPVLRDILQKIADDLQGGEQISKALSKHPQAFSSFYVNMVRSGEESGKLDQTFMYLSEHLDRTYEVTSKDRNALIYPIFVIATFVSVMFLMFSVVIPKISVILQDNGADVPIYTKIILNISNFSADYGIFFIIAVIIGGYFLYRYTRTENGKLSMDQAKITVPYVGTLYTKLYLSRIADSMQTMLLSGVSMIKALEVTQSIVDNSVYEKILGDVIADVKGGSSVSQAMSLHKEIPSIMVQMIRVGEETGELGNILKTLANFYRREVLAAVDTLVGLIEPVMIVALGLGVGILLAAVLVPIYNVASTFGA